MIGGFGQSLGMFAVQAAVSRGARRVVYLDDDPARLAKAKSLGAEVHEAPKGLAMEPIGLFPIVIDAAATDASILLAFRSTEPNGICQRMYGDFTETTPVPLRHMYGVGITLPRSAASTYAPNCPDCVGHVAAGRFPSRAGHHAAAFASRTRMRRSAIRPSGSPSFAMALTKSTMQFFVLTRFLHAEPVPTSLENAIGSPPSKSEWRTPDMTETDSVLVDREGAVTIISINRPHCRNAVDGATARKLYDAFLAFDADKDASVAVFTGVGGYFCAGADLKKVAAGDPEKKRELRRLRHPSRRWGRAGCGCRSR